MTAGPTIKVQHNFKSGAVLSNVYGETAQDANDQIAGIDWGLVAAGQADMDAAFTIVGTLGARPATPGPAPAYPDVPTNAGPPASVAPAAPTSGPSRPANAACDHGDYVYSAFTSKAGKDVKMWKCPADTGKGQSSCAPVWIR